jgi:recombinational DNA repair protein RecR
MNLYELNKFTRDFDTLLNYIKRLHLEKGKCWECKSIVHSEHCEIGKILNYYKELDYVRY